MSRRCVEVLAVTDELAEEVSSMWLAYREDLGSPLTASARSTTQARIDDAIRQQQASAWLARIGRRAVGFVITQENLFGLAGTEEVVIHHLYVDRTARKQGVARALLGAVLDHSELIGCDVVVSNVPATDRDANRFFARLGFSSVVVRRAVSVAALRRRIGPVAGGHTGIEQVLRQRRSLRARRGAGPAHGIQSA